MRKIATDSWITASQSPRVQQRFSCQIQTLALALGLFFFVAMAAPAAEHPIRDRQTALNILHRSLDELWDSRVEFDVAGETFAGFATLAAADGGEPFWGDEAGALSDAPLWDFQGSFGTPGALLAFLYSYQATGNREYLRRAESLGDTLIVAQHFGEGWFYDVAIIDGFVRNVGVWGSWGNRRHAPEDLQGWYTLDDSVSQASALALLRLYQVSGESRFLDAAVRFGDMIVSLPNQTLGLVQPYRAGGIPQALPMERVLTVGYNTNNDPRNPDAPYMLNKTMNDNTTSDAIIVLVALYEETGEERFRDAVRLNVDYLLARFFENGGRAWSQQYHFLTDAPAWGRDKEPPVYVTTEHHIVDALLLWRSLEPDFLRRLEIEVALRAYCDWLDTLPRVTESPTHIWRYYNSDASAAPVNEVVFANDYQQFFGVESEDLAGPGQPYHGSWDNVWSARLRNENGSFNLDLWNTHLDTVADQPLGMIPATWTPTDEEPTAASHTRLTLNGVERVAITTRGTAFRIYGLTRRMSTYPGTVTDSDADGFANVIEIAESTDPLDSASTPDWVAGDVNCDGVFSLGDIPAFITALTNATGFAAVYPNCRIIAADANADGILSVSDISAFVDRLVSNGN